MIAPGSMVPGLVFFNPETSRWARVVRADSTDPTAWLCEPVVARNAQVFVVKRSELSTLVARKRDIDADLSVTLKSFTALVGRRVSVKMAGEVSVRGLLTSVVFAEVRVLGKTYTLPSAVIVDGENYELKNGTSVEEVA